MENLNFFRNELSRLENMCEDDEGLKLQKAMSADVLELIEVFSKQGHSGLSASYCLEILDKLLRFKPLTPLTGEDDEWEELEGIEIDDHIIYINKRCFSVSKTVNTKDGSITYKDGDKYSFTTDGGNSWFSTNSKSILNLVDESITFPYVAPAIPTFIYLKELSDDTYEIITDEEEIKKMRNE